MVYYVDKIQDLETEIARLRSLRSSDKLKQLRDAAEEGGEEAEDGEQSGSDEALADCQQGKGKKMGERVYAAVCQEKEDQDEVILTRTKLDKGIQVSLEDKPEPAPPPKTVSKGIQVGDSSEAAPPPAPPPPPPRVNMTKPNYTYTDLITLALKDKTALTVSGIYQWIT